MTDETDVYLAAGKLIVFSTGSYSDYGYRGMFVTLQPLLKSKLREVEEDTEREYKRLDAENDAAREAWASADHDKRGGYPSMPSLEELFQTNLIKAGLLMVIDYNELHIGEYGSLSLSL